MATQHYDIGRSWAEITEAGTNDDFILEHVGMHGVLMVRFDTATPGANDPAHPLYVGDSIIRAGADGKVYARAEPPGPSDTTIPVVVSGA